MSLPGLTRIGKPRKWNQVHTTVNPEAIERYIKGPFKNHDYVKDLRRDQILRELPRFRMHT